MNNSNKPRWQYRFNNYKRAYFLLQQANNIYAQGNMTDLEKEGMIQRFEFCLELAWKTIKDYMEYKNFVFEQVFPSLVIKEAFSSKVIHNADAWMNALDDRNKTSHTYDFSQFEVVLKNIDSQYLECFGELYEKLASEVT